MRAVISVSPGALALDGGYHDRRAMINFAILGCGRIAKRHAELLGTGQIAGIRLVAVCDSRPERAAAYGKKYDVPSHSSLSRMLEMPTIDAVAVLTPSGMHCQHSIEVARSGRHVVVEKPMALTVADAESMIAAASRGKVRLFVVKQNRFNVPIVKAREAFEAGRFGKLVLGTVRVRWCREQSYYDQDAWRGTWAQDGGVISNQASHHVDMLSWFMGEAESVHARGMAALVNIEAEDTAVATVRFANGALGVIEATTASRPRDLEGSFSILGSGGAVEVAGFAMNEIRSWQFASSLESDQEVIARYSVNPPNVYGFGHQAYYEHVVDCLNNGTVALVDGAEGKRSLGLVAALYESMASGREVAMPARLEKSLLGRSSY
jgi:UDP-N-acetyl-2-amino-2-deoxyglucuronate dehydrogenase